MEQFPTFANWAKEAFSNDKKQICAFESITAAVLLTFYDHEDDTTTEGNQPQLRFLTKYRQAREALMLLKGGRREHQLICLLHGPGGSGKSTVVNLVQAYVKSYCHNIGQPYTWSTIMVTAM